MKLRNKKTGEVYTACRIIFGESIEGLKKNQWKTLEEFNEDWEDYEEPKKYWFIDAFGNIVQNEITKHRGDEYTDMSNEYENQKQIGNYFETEEEAEKAVEKLKAWKRLKDKGFRFVGWQHDVTNQKYIITMEEKDFEDWVVGSKKADLDLLFRR
jgi:hypothetical protein